MKYSNKAFAQAASVLRARREKAEDEAAQRKSDFQKSHPELIEIEQEMALTGLDTIKAMRDCPDPKGYIAQLKKKNLAFQKARADLLKVAGVDKDYLKPRYTCPVCNDTGYVNGEICKCHEEILKSYAFRELADCTPLKISSFDDFNVSLYADAAAKKRMKEILNFCKDYADDFDTSSQSLFMCGETGLGKTHLSLAIAGNVIKRGYGVIYGSAQNLLTMLEREHFGKSSEPDGTTEDKLLCCDLLILDDLGAEYTTQFTTAQLYNIINTRMAKELPTIINSNVRLEDLEKQYTSRITSRIIGTYQVLQFIGNDIRQLI